MESVGEPIFMKLSLRGRYFGILDLKGANSGRLELRICSCFTFLRILLFNSNTPFLAWLLGEGEVVPNFPLLATAERH